MKIHLFKVAAIALTVCFISLTATSYSRCAEISNAQKPLKGPPEKMLMIYKEAMAHAKSLINKNDLDTAIKYYLKIIAETVPENNEDSEGAKSSDNELPEDNTAKKIDIIRKQALYSVAMCYFYKKNLDEAEKHFIILTKESPKNAMAHMQLGNLNDMKNDITKARYHYDKSVEFGPENAVIHYNFAIHLEKNKDIKYAIKHYRLARSFNKEWDLPQKALDRLGRLKEDTQH